MQSNYEPLGDFIKEVKTKNSDLGAKELLGINIDKFFMPSVANIVGVDLSKYKLVKQNQFACNRMHVGRDGRIPVALSQRVAPFMVSPAYDVFEIKDPTKLLPEYLMMWFSRREFDRNAWFYTDGDVRGGLAWKAFCNMKLPVPSPEKQREIVAEYHTIQNRITLNNQLIQTLETTAQAIYKQWFVEFEFPNEAGRPYKSSGGELVDSELGEIPKGWEVGKLGDIADVVNGFAFESASFCDKGSIPIVKISNIVPPVVDLKTAQYYSGEVHKSMKRSFVEFGDIVISMTGSHASQINSAVGKVGRYNYQSPAILNQRIGNIKPKNSSLEFLYRTIIQKEIQSKILAAATGSANQANISPGTIKAADIVKPHSSLVEFYEHIAGIINVRKGNKYSENRLLHDLKDLLLSKLATIESPTPAPAAPQPAQLTLAFA